MAKQAKQNYDLHVIWHILTHLRDPQATHVHGCWALDLVLGKE